MSGWVKSYVLDALKGELEKYMVIDESKFAVDLWSGTIELDDVKLRNDNLFRSLNLTGVNGVISKLKVVIPWSHLQSQSVTIVIDGVYVQLKPLDIASLDKKEARYRAIAAKQEKIALADKSFAYHAIEDGDDDDGGGHAAGGNSKKGGKNAETSSSSKVASPEGHENLGWFDSLKKKIVENLEIKLTNIHVRYEDTNSIPGNVFSAGFTLGSFTFTTTNEHWNPTFVERDFKQAIRKLCATESVGAYWNMRSPSLESIAGNFAEWKRAMQSIIYNPQLPASQNKSYDPNDKSGAAVRYRAELAALKAKPFIDNQAGPDVDPNSPQAMKYILLPTNSLTIKVVFNDHIQEPGKEQPKFDITVVNEKLNISVDGLQYKQLTSTVELINQVEKLKQPKVMYRPPQGRPGLKSPDGDKEKDKEHMRAWWRYVFIEMKYIRLVELKKTANTIMTENNLSEDQRYQMEYMEDKLPLQVIIRLRHFTSIRMATEAKKRRKTYLASGRASISKKENKEVAAPVVEQGWLSYYWYGASAAAPPAAVTAPSTAESDKDKDKKKEEENEISIEAFQSLAIEESKKAAQQQHTTFLKFSLESSANLQLSAYGVPVLQASMSMHVVCEQTLTGLVMKLDLDDMQAKDLITPNPVLPNIISVRQIESGEIDDTAAAIEGESGATTAGLLTHHKANFTIIFDSTGKRPTLTVVSQPVVFACNKLCIQYIFNILFSVTPAQKELQRTASANAKKANAAANALVRATSGVTPAFGNSSTGVTNRILDTIIGASGKKGPISRLGEEGDDAMEIIFKAHAPKIIIPENSSTDSGYLLLDAGCLGVRGFTGDAGMRWEISLSGINAGMPVRASEMYHTNKEENQALYLIRPFDIDMKVQNEDKVHSDMTVDIDIKPEIRGELSARKLERLLDLINVASSTFVEPPFELSGMSDLKSLDLTANLACSSSRSTKRASVTTNTNTSLRDLKQGGGNVGVPVLQRAPSSSSTNNAVHGDNDAHVDNSAIHELITELQSETDADPTHVGLLMVVKIPVMALDLIYDEEQGYNQVFEVSSLVAKVTNRPHDLAVEFSMEELTMKDTMRSMLQRSFVSTPKEAEDDRLIQISYIECGSRLSPYYIDSGSVHGSKCTVDFTNLKLTLDVNTLNHVRPFIIALLHREQTNVSLASSKSAVNIRGQGQGNDEEEDMGDTNFALSYLHEKPEYMHMVMTMRNLSLDILRVRESEEEFLSEAERGSSGSGVAVKELEKAFSLNLIGLNTILDMRELMNALVTVQSVEIVDIREISRDYANKKVFGHKAIANSSACEAHSSGENSAEGGAGLGAGTGTEASSAGTANEGHIIKLVFAQQSKTVSNIEVEVNDASTFGSTDTFLDMSNVVLDNFKAILALLEKPPADYYTNGITMKTVKSSSSIVSSLADMDILGEEDGSGTIFRDSFSGTGSAGGHELKNSSEYLSAGKSSAGGAQCMPQNPYDSNGNVNADAFTQQTMMIHVQVNNPTVRLIDNPTAKDSQAIVVTCGCDVHYTRDTTTEIATNMEDWSESIHCTVKSLEVYVLDDVQCYFPKAILQPVALEFNMKREGCMNNILLNNIRLDTGDISMRVTLNDMVLAQSILFRGATHDRRDNEDIHMATSRKRLGSGAGADSGEGYDGMTDRSISSVSAMSKTNVAAAAAAVPTQSNIALNLGQVSLIAINDFSSQDVPVAKISLQETSLSLSTKGETSVWGEGNLYASASFFNSKINMWEPILDRWHPKLDIDSGAMGMTMNIRSAHTMQMTVSGCMLKTFLETSSLLQQVRSGHDTGTGVGSGKKTDKVGLVAIAGIGREFVSEIVIENQLGESLDVELYDTISSPPQFLMKLSHGKAMPLSKISDSSSSFSESTGKIKDKSPRGAQMQSLRMPETVNIHFTGAFGTQRANLINLPLYAHKPRLYHLLPKAGAAGSSSSSRAIGASTTEEQQAVTESAIEEEIFENSRLGTKGWGKPFVQSDPPEWSDATGLNQKSLESIKCPPGWEWQNRWKPAGNSVGNGSVDSQGWEYSTSFSNFSVSNERRTQQKGDTVRRRRWIRSRLVKSASVEKRLHGPMVLHWDVRVLPSGGRTVLIRSGMQIKNQMTVAMMISFSHADWTVDAVFGPIESGGTFCVPLLTSCATSMKMRPVHSTVSGNAAASAVVLDPKNDESYSWSPPIPCAIQSTDFNNKRDVISSSVDTKVPPVCICLLMNQTNKSLTVTFEPYIIVENLMPCDLSFRVVSTVNGTNKQQEESICCGASSKLAHLNLQGKLKLSLAMSSMQLWSTPINLPPPQQNEHEGEQEVLHVELPNSQGPGRDRINNGLIMSVCTHMTNSTLHVCIYPRYLLVDRTGLSLSVKTNKGYHDEMCRSAFSACIGTSGTSGSSGSTHLSDMRKSAAGAIAAGGGSKVANRGSIHTSNSFESSASSGDCGDDYGDVWKDSTGLIQNFKKDSSNDYRLTLANHADAVYTDRSFIWTHLPEPLRNQTYISTSYNDKLRQAEKFLQFDVYYGCYVVLAVDRNTRGSLPWLKADGYKEMIGHAVARRVHAGQMQEICYSLYGKFYEAGSNIVLRGNFCRENTAMYTVFVVPASEVVLDADIAKSLPLWAAENDRFFSQLSFETSYNREKVNSCWQDGGEGLCLFHTSDDHMKIGVKNASAWSDSISISMENVKHFDSFEVQDWKTKEAYQLTYVMRYLPGVFNRTQEVVIIPRFCVVNLLDEDLHLMQKNTSTQQSRTYHPYRADGWHKSDLHQETIVQMRCSSSSWSLGALNITELGTSSLYLPRKDASKDGENVIVLHVEVKVAGPEENCAVVILVWRAEVESSTDMSIENRTDCAVTVMQAGLHLDRELRQKGLFQTTVSPFSSAPFGWADPDLTLTRPTVLVTVGMELTEDMLSGRNGRAGQQSMAEINMLEAGEQIRLPDYTSGSRAGSKEVVLSVLVVNGARVLRITRPVKSKSKKETSAVAKGKSSVTAGVSAGGSGLGESSSTQTPTTSSAYKGHEVNFFLDSFGVSLVVEKPVRREFLSLYMDGLSYQQLVADNGLCCMEIKVNNMQIDNYSESAVSPVLLHDNKESDKDQPADAPLIQCSWVRHEQLGNHMPIYKMAVFRILPITLEIDSATIELLSEDLLNELKYVTREQTLASTAPEVWIDERNQYLVSAERLQLLDVYSSKARSLQGKMYFEQLVIHPMVITISFTQTPFPRKRSSDTALQNRFMNIIKSFAGMEKMELKLNSFKTDAALETADSLRSALLEKTKQEIMGQLVEVIGSMAAIGSPLGFARKIGGGVSDLFYEPFRGGITSPKAFLLGVGKGTSSLATNIISGMSASINGISGSASKGLGYLAGDGDYVRQRALKKQQNKTGTGGVIDGIGDGIESVFSGIGSGITGLVSRPLDGAEKGGIGGFFKGVGLGLVGAVVKPLHGIADGISAVSSGVNKEISTDAVYVHVRPMRALERRAADIDILVIGNMDVKAAQAQDFVLKRAKNSNPQYEDSFLSFSLLKANPKTDESIEAVILTETYIFWRKEKSLWGRTWANVSHVLFFGESVGIFLYSSNATVGNGNDGREIVEIFCYTREKAINLYGNLASTANRMGNPCNVIPLSSVVHEEWLTDKAFREKVLATRGRAPALDNTLDGYRFGSVNLPFRKTDKSDIGNTQHLREFQAYTFRPISCWEDLDSRVWAMIEQWDISHRGLHAARCCVFVVINRSDSALELSRIKMDYGRKLDILGSDAVGYDMSTKSVLPDGIAVIFAYAEGPTPLEVGHIKAHIDCPAFRATLASTQRESNCEARGAFRVGFLEKSVSEWWSKYILYIS